MFAQSGKTGDDEGEEKDKKQKPQRNLDHTNCNDCGEKGQYKSNNECYTKTKIKEDEFTFIKTKQEKSGNKPPDGGEQKTLIKFKNRSCSIMMGIPTEEWDDLPSPGIMLCHTSSK